MRVLRKRPARRQSAPMLTTFDLPDVSPLGRGAEDTLFRVQIEHYCRLGRLPKQDRTPAMRWFLCRSIETDLRVILLSRDLAQNRRQETEDWLRQLEDEASTESNTEGPSEEVQAPVSTGRALGARFTSLPESVEELGYSMSVSEEPVPDAMRRGPA